MELHKFPSIAQYRNVIHHVKHTTRYRGQDSNDLPLYDNSRLPVIPYRGTVKLHGTNTGIVFDCRNETFSFQSRERVLSLEHDHMGFKRRMLGAMPALQRIVDGYRDGTDPDMVTVFGEWCGQSVQKGVAVTQLPKMVVIFAVRLTHGETETWVDSNPDLVSPDDRIFCIDQFPVFDLDIDFNAPEIAQQRMVEITEAVERECPVGKHFGVVGVGEGVVWRPRNMSGYDSGFWFKVKGEKHSVSHVRTLAPIDVEKVASLREFAEQTATEQRFEQGIHWLLTEAQKPLVIQSMGAFIHWVVSDIVKEEADTIVASDIDPKKLSRPVAERCREWFLRRLSANAEVVA